jgi:ubiquitin C-terminal hydrolase, putative
MSSAGDWCLIESDPGVFTELIKGFGKFDHDAFLSFLSFLIVTSIKKSQFWSNSGVTGIQVEELWSLSSENFENIK